MIDHRSYAHNVSSCESKAWKKWRSHLDSKPWFLRYGGSAQPTELSKLTYDLSFIHLYSSPSIGLTVFCKTKQNKTRWRDSMDLIVSSGFVSFRFAKYSKPSIGILWTHNVTYVPSWLDSSVCRALQQYGRGHWTQIPLFLGLNFIQALIGCVRILSIKLELA